MYKRFLMAAAVAAIAHPALGQEAPTPEGGPPGLFSDQAIDREVEATREWLELSLTDYETARFRDVRVVLVSPNRRDPSQVVLMVCGMVNARNRMGGYTGFKTFYHGSDLPGPRKTDFGVFAPEVCGRANPLNQIDYTDRLAPKDPQ